MKHLKTFETYNDFPPAHIIDLNDDQIERLKEVVASSEEPHTIEYDSNLGHLVETTYKITPEWEQFFKEVGIRKDLFFGYDVEDGRESYHVKHRSKFPGRGRDHYGIVKHIKLPK